ncbi:hypothetical protein BJ546DRAFT_225601 [Cryomyces antarcticus]|uniref:aspartate--tRNA ligase n=1 Tax=Cryomyces antarcticus TaxID=329879 RepID=A0ABR0KT95_9PEZI|nr:aspartate--tRNA ligase dps1 [Cryomyces antarcticus]
MPSALKKTLSVFKPRSRSTSRDVGDDEKIDSPKRLSTGQSTPTTNGASSPRTSTSINTSNGFHHNSKDLGHHRATPSPIGAIKDKALHVFGNDSSSSDDDGESMSKNQQRKHEKQVEREQRKQEAERRQEEQRKRRQEAEERAAKEESEDVKARYGILPINNYAGKWNDGVKRTDILKLTPKDVGQEVTFRARIHNIRKVSAHMGFFVFRQRSVTVQGVLHEHGSISPHMVYWAEHLQAESVALVKGIVQEPRAKQGEVIGATVHHVEISVHEMHVEARPSEPLPFTVHEAEASKQELKGEDDPRHIVSDRARMTNRIVDLRTTASQSIFRIQSGICNLFRSYLDTQGFIEIYTPKLQGGATESGASVFKLDYFGRPAFLAQSPQLAKQMCISADFGRVYEIGAVFRAENSNTHRHLTEYTGLDIEMAIDEHYLEVLRVLDHTFKAIFKGIYDRYRHELDVVKRQFPHEDLVWREETPIIPFAQGIKMLNNSGWRQENGEPLPENEDLGTRDEIQLGKLVKEKYHTDYYVLDKFPASARPFYTMPDPNDSSVTNSFDIFLRGQEILSGGQRIHDAEMLTKQMQKLKVDPQTMEDYMSGFEWGAPPHGGGGIGLERMLMLLLGLGDIRHGSLFPRDPKSLPAKPVAKQLRHPEASTLRPPWEGKEHSEQREFQPIEKLIANYGDASNTSWLEERTEIWRDQLTGAAVGFVDHQGFAITVGDPLCDGSQYNRTISGYLRFIKKERNLKSLWLLAGHGVEEALATKHNWRTFSVAAEQRLDPSNNPAAHDHDVQRKIRQAEKVGIKIHGFSLGEPVPEDARGKIDDRVKDWLANRKGKQVHLTEIHPWQDMAHRQYYYSTDHAGKMVALVVLAQLSPEHGWQVKYSLGFPGAPSGTIEHIVVHALKAVAAAGATSVTFGGGTTSKFQPGHNLKGARVKILAKAYHAIATELRLTNKSEFREKLGAQEDPIYVCYPPHGLGPMAVKAIMSFFEDEE